MKKLFTILSILITTCSITTQNAFSQSWDWAKTIGGAEFDQVNAVAVDSFGNSYVTGSFYETALFGVTELTATGEADIFLAKFDPDGGVLWVVRAGGLGFDEGKELSLDQDGNVYLVGVFSEIAGFNSIKLNSNGDLDVFLAKYSSDGQLLAVNNAMGTSTADVVTGISHDLHGFVYIIGDNHVGVNQDDIFFAKFNDSNLGLEYVQFIGGTAAQNSIDITTDNGGNSYITGTFDGTIKMGDATLVASSSHDFFISKYDIEGHHIWSSQVEIDGFAQNAGLSLDAFGNCYLLGNFDFSVDFGKVVLRADGEMEALYAKYNSQGTFQWARSSNNEGFVTGTAIDTDSDGNSYIAGRLNGSSAFGDLKLTSNGKDVSYVVKLDKDGYPIWGTNNEIITSNYVSDLAVDLKGNSWLTGRFYGKNGIEGSAVLTSSREFDGFLGKLQPENGCKDILLALATTNIDSEHATINWDDAEATTYQYRYRKLPNGPWEPMLKTTASTATLSSLESFTDYVFHIQAFCEGVQKGTANIQFTTLEIGSCASAPQNLEVSKITTSSALISWESLNQPDLMGYQLRLHKPDGSWAKGFTNDAVIDLTGMDAGSTYKLLITSRCVDGKSASTSISFTTEINTSANLQLASNPKNNTLTITPSEPMLVRIYDSNENLKSEVFVQKYGMEINLSSLKKGQYHVKGMHPSGTITQRLVKE